MQFRQLITNEDGEAAAPAPASNGTPASNGATVSSDIGTVAYPLFVPGRTRRQKRRNARQAVGQKMNSVPSYVGKGVYEQYSNKTMSRARHLAKKAMQNRAEIKTPQDAIRVLVRLRDISKDVREGNTYTGNLAKEYYNDVWDVYIWIEKLNMVHWSKVTPEVLELKGIISDAFDIRKEAKRLAQEPGFRQPDELWFRQAGSGADTVFAAKIVQVLEPWIDWLETNMKTNQENMAEGQWFRTAYGWAGGSKPDGGTYKHPDQIKADREANQEWMSDTELDQYVPDTLVQEWRELVGYNEDGMAHPLWINMTGDYEPNSNDPQHRRWMVKVANKWFAMKKIPNVEFFDVRDINDELEWLVKIGDRGVKEGTKKIPASNKPVDPKDAVVSLKDVPIKKPRGYKQYDPANDFPGVKVFQKEGVAEDSLTAEAHTLDSNNVIYRLDREDPMNASEVLVLGGAGRYSMAGLRDKARKEAQALAADLEGNHGSAFRGAAHNIKQLTNTLNTIVAAYNELKRIRSKGGRGSRGITDEDKNFIRECLTIAERWTLRYIQEKENMIRIQLMHEGRVVKQISSRVHESVILERVNRYQDPIDTIIIVEGQLSEGAKDILKRVAKKIIPAAMAAGIAVGGVGAAQAQGGENPNYPGLNRSIGQHISDIFSPNYEEIMRQRRYAEQTRRAVWNAQAEVDRRAQVDAARDAARKKAGVSSVKIYDQARVSQDGKSYLLYDMEHRVIRIPVVGTEFIPGDSQRLPHYITSGGGVYYVRLPAPNQFTEVTEFNKTGGTTDVEFNNKGQLTLATNKSKLDSIINAHPEAVKAFKDGKDLSDFPDFYDELYEYYFDEMPHGVVNDPKDDPYTWISDRLKKKLKLEQPMEAHTDDLELQARNIISNAHGWNTPADPADPEDPDLYVATDADRRDADKNIIMQIRKASDYEKPFVLNLGDGSTKKIDALLAKKILGFFDNLKPESKELMQKMLNTRNGFTEIIGFINEQEIKESMTEIDLIVNNMKPIMEMTKKAKLQARSIINAAYTQVSED